MTIVQVQLPFIHVASIDMHASLGVCVVSRSVGFKARSESSDSFVLWHFSSLEVSFGMGNIIPEDLSKSVMYAWILGLSINSATVTSCILHLLSALCFVGCFSMSV